MRWRRCGGSKLAKRAVLRQGVQQRQQRRQGVLEGLVQRQHLPREPGPPGAGVVRVLDLGIALEQVDDGEVGRGFAVGHRGALQHAPALRVLGMDALIDQAGLAHPGFAHHRHHLAVPCRRPLSRLLARPPARAAARQSG